MATKKKSKSKKPTGTIILELTMDEANELYDFVNTVHIRYDGSIEVFDSAKDVIAGSDIDQTIFDKLTDLGVEGERSIGR